MLDADGGEDVVSDTHRASAVPLLTRSQEQAVEHRHLPPQVVCTIKDPEITAEPRVLVVDRLLWILVLRIVEQNRNTKPLLYYI